MKSITRAAFAAACLLAATGAQAATVIDQSQLAFNTGMPFAFGPTYPNYPIGQSFTAGLSHKLTGVTIYCNGICDLNGLSNDFTMSLYAGAGTAGSLLGTVTQTQFGVADPSAGGLNALRMDVTSLGILLSAGSQYTFAFTAITGPGDMADRGTLASTANPYAGGRQLATPGYGDNPGFDLMFKTDVAATVPEPASWALMIGGFGLTGATLRRRRSAFA